MILIILWIIFVLWLFFVYFFPQFYVCELIISFLPYIVFFSLIVACVFFFLFLKNVWKFRYLSLVLSLSFFLCFFLYAFKYNQFYTWQWFLVWESEKVWLDILYSNILYKTKNYDEINSWILNNDADLVLMVEFTDDFGQNMSQEVLEKYPYSARVEYSDKYYGNVVFSKYPIKNLTQEIEWWTWRYSYFSLNYKDIDYYIYLVHTAAPVSFRHFSMRNHQLQELAEDYKVNVLKKDENDRILMLWDFNLSPWSVYYTDLEKSLDWLYDLTRDYTLLFTWAYRNFPLIASHIDHVFMDKNSKIDSLIKVKTPKSDHRWFLIKNFR